MDTRLVLVRDAPPGSREGVTAPADLWVVDLGPSVPHAASLLLSLAELRAVVPLLVIVESSLAGAYERELGNLLDAWPAPARLMFWPFPAIELRVQVHSLTHGIARLPTTPEVYDPGALRVDTGQMRAWYGGVPLVLKHPEFMVLAALARARGNVVSKAALLGELHDDPSLYEEDAVRSYVSRLRTVLRAAGAHPECIRTVHGQGYALELALLERRNETTRKLRRIDNDPISK